MSPDTGANFFKQSLSFFFTLFSIRFAWAQPFWGTVSRYIPNTANIQENNLFRSILHGLSLVYLIKSAADASISILSFGIGTSCKRKQLHHPGYGAAG